MSYFQRTQSSTLFKEKSQSSTLCCTAGVKRSNSRGPTAPRETVGPRTLSTFTPPLLFFFFPCSADHERDWPPCKVVFWGLATNALNVRNNSNKQRILKNGNELFGWERNEKKSVGDFEKWYPSKAPSMTFEDPGRMNA